MREEVIKMPNVCPCLICEKQDRCNIVCSKHIEYENANKSDTSHVKRQVLVCGSPSQTPQLMKAMMNMDLKIKI